MPEYTPVDEYGYPVDQEDTQEEGQSAVPSDLTAPADSSTATATTPAPPPVAPPIPGPAQAPAPAPVTMGPPAISPIGMPGLPAVSAGAQGPTQALQARIDMARLMGNAPIDQAEAAVGRAMKFQALRGYQQDVNSGMSSGEALAKWAPIMFMAPKASNLGQAASFIRATRPPRPQDIGGTPYVWDPRTQRMTVAAGFVPKPTVPRVSPLDLQTHKSYLDQSRKLEAELDEEPSGPAADEKRNKLQYLRSQMAEIDARSRAPVTAQAAPAATGQTVIRRTKEGRRAIFDAQTKRFLGYAPDQQR